MLTVSNLIKNIKGRTIIQNLSFKIRKKEKVCLFAPSGAGKSTLINIVSGLDKKFTGSVSVKARFRTTLFQEPGLFWYKNVEENILYPLKLNQVVLDAKIRNSYNEWMEVTSLKESCFCYPYELSGGMKQKVAIIRAFLLSPDLVFMDEPFNSIDMAAKLKIIDYIRARYKDATLLLVTHHPDEIPLITDRVLLFKEPHLSERFESLEISANRTLLHDSGYWQR